MKKIYKITLLIFVIECLCINKFNIKIDSIIGTILGLALVSAPIIVLLYLLGRDEDIAYKYRVLAKILNIFIVVWCIAGVVVKILGLEN